MYYARDVAEKEMVTHSSVLTLRIPGMGKPGGLPCRHVAVPGAFFFSFFVIYIYIYIFEK